LPATSASAEVLSGAELRAFEKQRKAAKRKLEREETELMEEIAEKESEKSAQEHILATPEVYTDGEKSKMVQQKIESLEQTIEALTVRWEAVTEALGEYT